MFISGQTALSTCAAHKQNLRNINQPHTLACLLLAYSSFAWSVVMNRREHISLWKKELWPRSTTRVETAANGDDSSWT